MNRKIEKISIVIIVYNALKYFRITLNTIKITSGIDYEVVVVDNSSNFLTKLYLIFSFLIRRINKLCLLDENTMYSGGNNIGVSICRKDCSHVVLLNSDVEIRDPLWLRKLLDLHRAGATAYGYVEGHTNMPARADGYCFLVDKKLYDTYRLNEDYKWWWGLTELQSKLLRDGYDVRAVDEHDHILFHFGGKSGISHLKKDESNFKTPHDVNGWFKGKTVLKISRII